MDSFDSGKSRPLEWRQRQLTGIIRFCFNRRQEILAALRDDLGKPTREAVAADIGASIIEAVTLKMNLRKWAKRERVSTPFPLLPANSYIEKEPFGVVLIIGAWNYPLQLTLLPLAGAVAAGNCAIIKPSEVAPRTSELLSRVLPDFIDSDCIRVVEGGPDVTSQLLQEPFDYIFYTGSGAIGKIVMRAAAERLIPVTLELGGKSPCLVDRDISIQVAAKRIALGKWMNAGQTCIAPDYVLVHQQAEGRLLEALRGTIQSFYGNNPQKSPNYARIVNKKHFDRISKFLKDGKVVIGGESDPKDCYIAPTVIRVTDGNAPVMQEEVFGPLLPVMAVRDMEEAIAFVRSRPKPLALYLFSNNTDVQQRVIAKTSAGGVCINHTVLHAGNPNLPFGGVGASGIGAYHGRRTFETFTHRKPVLEKPVFPDFSFMYPKEKSD
ncbi:MAG: aldehyde dehydrogenase family protein [Deltaproteobacteria bacterium]|nr:aldehyde dehydrogenase family protein [Deltaproteobacteria bacterium]